MSILTKAFYASAAMVSALSGSIPAMAQGIAVHDSANLLQQINAVRQAIQVVAQGRQQILEAQKLYQDLNKLTDISQISSQLRTDALRALDTSPANLQGFGTGNLDVVGAGRSKAEVVYQALLEKLGASGSDQSRASYDLTARNIGIQAGLAQNLGVAATSRTEGLEQLRSRLATASTAKEVADLTARLNLEMAAMQNDQLRLQAIAMQQEAAEKTRAAEGRAALSQKLDAANAYYRGQ